jgi:hypothetical protein
MAFQKTLFFERKSTEGVCEQGAQENHFMSRGNELTEGCRELRNEELRELHVSPNVIIKGVIQSGIYIKLRGF